MFSAYVGDHFFLLSTNSTYSRVSGDKGGQIFTDIFFLRSFYVQIGVVQFVSHVQFYAKLNVSNLYVMNL